jgi:hypothetical protein
LLFPDLILHFFHEAKYGTVRIRGSMLISGYFALLCPCDGVRERIVREHRREIFVRKSVFIFQALQERLTFAPPGALFVVPK